MASHETIERFFLLELLVDNVFLAMSDLNLDPRTMSALKQTCVKFQFLNYPTLEFCEEDFVPKGNYDSDNISFKSGKSCLFALKGQHPSALSPPFNMNVTVCKMMANKKQCELGRTCIKLSECFATIVNCCIACPDAPTSQTIRETFPLVNDTDCEIGSITVFIRLSCFGKYIVTQFQLGGIENKSFLFRAESENGKGKEQTEQPPQQEGQDRIIMPRSQTQPIAKRETYCEVVGGGGGGGGGGGPSGTCMKPTCPGGGGSMPPPMGMGPGMGMPPMMPPPMMPPFGGFGGMMPPPNFGNSMPGGMQLMPLNASLGGGGGGPKSSATSDYKELTASVNGHELCIRILRKPKKPRITRVLSSDSSETNAKGKLDQNFCDCEVDLPKEIMGLKGKKKKTYGSKSPCPWTSGKSGGGGYSRPMPKQRGYGDQTPNVNVKENFMVKLGNCPQVCFKCPPPVDTSPCTTVRESQYEQEDMDKAGVLYKDFLAEQAKAKKGGGGGGGGGGKKGGKKGKK